MKKRNVIAGALVPALWCGAAYGQATQNAVTEAEDAYGFVNGDESVGIYDESSVRGFDLEAAGNYRFNGRYFVKSSGVSSLFIENTTVRIGLNTFGVNFPGPSGVVDYRLRDPGPDAENLFTAGRGDFGGIYLEALLQHGAADRSYSYAGGARFEAGAENYQGGTQDSWLLAGTFRRSFGRGAVQLFVGEYDYDRDGKFVVKTDGTFLPGEIERGQFLMPHDMRETGQRRVVGLLTDAQLSTAWSASASAYFSQEDPNRKVTQVFGLADPEALADTTLIVTPAQRATAWSGEVEIGHAVKREDVEQHINLVGRARISRNRFGGGEAFDLGSTPFGERSEVADDYTVTGAANLRDEIDQFGLGIAYHLKAWKRLQLSAGLMRVDYEKRFTGPLGDSANTSKPWTYNIGTAYRITGSVELYGSYSRGIEEAGTAPANAANRNAVLNAVIATQREAGFRYHLPGGMSLIVAGFDTRKPYAGLNPDSNIYGLIGTVKHRGIEASLSGPLMDGLNVVLGGVLTDAKLSDDSGTLDRRPVAVPAYRAVAYANYALPGMEGLSLDAGLEAVGKAYASSRIVAGDQLRTPARVTVDVGARYTMPVAGTNVTMRAQLLNVFNDFSWVVSGAETFDYNKPRQLRLLVTAAF